MLLHARRSRNNSSTHRDRMTGLSSVHDGGEGSSSTVRREISRPAPVDFIEDESEADLSVDTGLLAEDPLDEGGPKAP